MWEWLFQHLMQNARVFRDAPLMLLVALLVGFGAAYWLSGNRYEGVLDQKNGTIESLRTQLSGLQDQVRALQQQLERRGQQQAPSTAVRDPDGIYQFGAQVGSVQRPQVERAVASFCLGQSSAP